MIQFTVIGYFYNPNIWPEEEYEKRLDSAWKVVKAVKIEMVPGTYENFMFEEKVNKLTQALHHNGAACDYRREKEGGKRCLLCYRMRLEKTAIFAKERGMDIFATTLSISPHKNTSLINTIGREVGKAHGINFYEADFKKDNGFGKSVRLSRNLGLYRQKYCGCRYSIPQKNAGSPEAGL